MSLIFNTLLAKKYYSALFLLLLSKSLLAATSITDKCATLNLTGTNEKSQSVIYELLSNNNSAIDNNAFINNTKNSVLLLPGQHSLKLREWPVENYLNYTIAEDQNILQGLIKKSVNHHVLITVESGFNYQMLSTNSSTQRILTLERSGQTCNIKSKTPLLAKHHPISADGLRSVILPNDLESRLYNLMDK